MALKNIWTLIRNVKCQHFPVLATYNCVRLLSISSLRFLKEIHRTETSNQIVIEGVKVKSDREGKVINLANRSGCPLCRVGLKNLKHTDILILNQFLNSDGSVIPQYITGLCNKQHFRVVRAVALAQRAGLIPKKPGTPLFGDWEKYNTYFKKF
ncbi:39S ribosomal protein S18a, mitochondrial-like isoform X2 [Stegodyphus dumicola]|uniref:39S ribosomal protein S18a, mitochondrial-like isoform X2 n=1 Tax=Stegodyphus dumicola TaxID=202533 RepID=UPI0015B123D1|nr:39S ribosomal protein S18a, mitochondrial-like isoform X2 [Stegodyphus dumicola]